MSKRKNYYPNKHTKQRKYNLEPGIRGFLCSCNNREKDCVREAYNILNKYADKFYPEAPNKPTDDDDLAAEIDALKSPEIKRFQIVDSGAKNFLFIRTTLENPLEIASSIVKDIFESGEQQTRFLLRLVPVQATCKAYIDDINATIRPLLADYFTGAAKTFSIAFNHRNNNSISRDDCIKSVADLVGELPEKHVVNLKEAEITIVIEIIKGFAFLGVIPDYLKYKKFNLHSIVEKETGEGAGDDKKDEDAKNQSDEANKEEAETAE